MGHWLLPWLIGLRPKAKPTPKPCEHPIEYVRRMPVNPPVRDELRATDWQECTKCGMQRLIHHIAEDWQVPRVTP